MSAPVTTFDRVLQILAEDLGATRDEVDSDTIFVADLGADSLDVVGVIVRAEQDFGVTLSDDELESVATVGQLVALLDAKTAEAAPHG